MNEQEILKTALETLELNTDIKATFLEIEPRKGLADDRIKLDGLELLTKVKKNVLRANVGTIINQLKKLETEGDTLLVGTYINDKLGNLLRDAKINYLDTAGNAYLKKKPLIVFIKGNTEPKAKVEPIDQAFTPTGLKVAYALLTQPELAKNGTHRDIADQADVALGAVGKIILDLIQKGFLNERIKTKERYWNKDHIWKMIEKWVEAYPKLRKKQFIGRYTTNDNQWWKAHDLVLHRYGAFLGGEIAAEQYTDHLKPEIGIVYLEADKTKGFLKDLRLAKARGEGKEETAIDLMEKFWREEAELQNHKNLVHPLIAYADLIVTADVRNIETAQIIKEDQLIPIVEAISNAN